MSVIGVGDWVEFPVGSKRRALVVDIDATDYCTPPPNLVLAWKERGRCLEGVVQTQHARKVKS